MEEDDSFAHKKEAPPLCPGWESSRRHTCTKVQEPWELKPCFNVGLLEESGGLARALPHPQCSVKTCRTEDHDESVQVIAGARPGLASSPLKERLY